MFDCKFNKAQYLLHEPIYINILNSNNKDLSIKVFNLEEEVSCKISNTSKGIKISNLPIGSYGISIETKSDKWEGAFDIVNNQKDIIRYGFLSDFSSSDLDIEDIEWMKDLHINTVQFYDWMYRHDNLLPSKNKYEDPLGRKLDLKVVKNKIKACKKYGMRPFAYGAIYAATKKTYEKNPKWAMYTLDGKPILFADWLYYMNISKNCRWSSHIINEYAKVINFGFSGIHMDTYGFPKMVWDYKGKPVKLEKEFNNLINRASSAVKKQDKNNGVIFNAVNNWPIEEVATSKQDSMYIEVWPPHDTYFDLYILIREARLYSNKNVILAAYMKPFKNSSISKAQNALRLTLAAISSAGGTQLVFGENKSVLMDAYYVNYANLSKSFLNVAKKYADFIVMYASLLYNDDGIDITKTSSGGINEDICFKAKDTNFSFEAKANTIWTIIRKAKKLITINLINLCGNDNLWNKAKVQPKQKKDIQIRFRLDCEVKGFFYASPDNQSLKAKELAYTYKITDQGRVYTIKLDSINYWTSIWVKLEGVK